jgi:hypothetical protein
MTATRLLKLALLALIAVALVLPVWLVRYPPLLDYPDHLARNFILAHLQDSAFHFQDFYRADWGPYPYLGMDLGLIALQRVFAPEVSGKLLLSFCVLAVPLAGWFFLREANPGHDALGCWVLLLAYSPFFLEGFINFQLGLASGLVTVALWLRYLKAPTRRRSLAVLVFATATYFMHLIAFALAGFVIFIYTLAQRRRWREILLVVALFTPGVLLAVYTGGVSGYGGAELDFRSWVDKYREGLSALIHGYSPGLEMVTGLALVACIVLARLGNGQFRLQRPWLWVLLSLLALYCALPREVGEAWEIDLRVIPVLFLVLLATAQLGRRQRVLAVVALLLVAARIADVTRNFVGKQTELAGMARAVQMLPRSARLLPLVHEQDEQDPLQRIYLHFWAYAIVERGALAPYLFDLKGQTPLRITTSAYIPPRPLHEPPDWGAVARDYDYIWVYDLPDWLPQLDRVARLQYSAGNLRLYRVPGRRVP